jgi:signal transduction histidine kinase
MVPVGTPDPVAAIGAYWATWHRATPAEIEVLSALADGTGLALTNVRLFDELRSSLAREQEARRLAESATAAKDEFLALIAHELRQPLHASLAALRLMKARGSREQGERARAVVERQIGQMTRLVDDLLEAGHVVRGEVHLDRRTIDIRETVRRVVDALTPLVTERAHDLRVIVPSQPARVDADDVRLQQVLMNLLSNAAKYTEAGGRIVVTLTVDDGQAVVSVADSGRGIEPALLNRVFELFTRGPGDAAGFGVGLAVARKLVELHGGRIEARSAGLGRGSEFVVILPCSGSIVTSQGGSDPSSASSGRHYAGRGPGAHPIGSRAGQSQFGTPKKHGSWSCTITIQAAASTTSSATLATSAAGRCSTA